MPTTEAETINRDILAFIKVIGSKPLTGRLVNDDASARGVMAE